MANNGLIKTEHMVHLTFRFGMWLGQALIEAHAQAEMYDKPVCFKFNEDIYIIRPTDTLQVMDGHSGKRVWIYSSVGIIQYSTVKMNPQLYKNDIALRRV